MQLDKLFMNNKINLIFSQVNEIVDKFKLDEKDMNSIMNVLESEMRLGLSRNEQDRKKSSLQMENTFVHQTIDGTGTSLRLFM